MSSDEDKVEIAKGVLMPNFGFGTSGLKGSSVVQEALDAAIRMGYRLIDTADFYGNAQYIGPALSQVLSKHNVARSDVFIQTKVNSYDKESAVDVLQRALKQLGLDYIDLFLVHYPYPFTKDGVPSPIDAAYALHLRKKVWSEMESILEKGLARAIGVSNYEIKHLEQMKTYANIMPAVDQLEFHPHLVRPDLIKYCKDNNVFVQGYTSMGRQSPDLLNEPILQRIASERKINVRQVLLAWSYNQGVGVIPKSSNPQRIESNLSAKHVRLNQSEIDELAALDKHHPYTDCLPWIVP